MSLVWSVAFVGSQMCVQLQMVAKSCDNVRPSNGPVRAVSQELNTLHGGNARVVLLEGTAKLEIELLLHGQKMTWPPALHLGH